MSKLEEASSLIDYHNHLEKGQLSDKYLSQFAETAQKKGIIELGITEHSYMFEEFRPVYERELERAKDNPKLYQKQKNWLENKGFVWSLDEYFDLLRSHDFADVIVRTGLEMDYFPDSEELIGEIIEQWPWDYILGSVHWVDGWIFDVWPQTWEGKNIARVYSDYYQTVLDAVRSDLFDVLGHLDAIKIFGHKPENFSADDLSPLIEAMVDRKVVAEINTSCYYKKKTGEFCPSSDILTLMCDYGVKVTFGSDAHAPDEVGSKLKPAIKTARKCGYTSYSRFYQRNRYYSALMIPGDGGFAFGK